MQIVRQQMPVIIKTISSKHRTVFRQIFSTSVHAHLSKAPFTLLYTVYLKNAYINYYYIELNSTWAEILRNLHICNQSTSVLFWFMFSKPTYSGNHGDQF